MRLQGIKIRLILTLGSLLLLGMLLVNFVLIIFWHRESIHRETLRDKAVLSHIQKKIPGDLPSFSRLPPDYFSFPQYYAGEENGCIVLALAPKEALGRSGNTTLSPPLAQTLAEAVLTAGTAVHYSGLFVGLMKPQEAVLISAQPVSCDNVIVGSVGVMRSLTPLFRMLLKTEKTLLIYILVNLLILLVIGFFRMVRLVIRPIERLVRLAEQYSDPEQDPILFAADNPGSEFGQLASSLNSMLTRIEHDRKALEQAVEGLEKVNSKLKAQQQEMVRTEKLAAIGRMAAGLAHEIGNPLGVVQGYLDLLKRSKEASEESLDFIKRADHELQRVTTLIRQMLDFARVSKGEPEVFSLHDLLLSVIDMVKVQSAFDTISLNCVLDAANDMVCADREQLRQVFVNCLLNSADAIVEAGPGHAGVLTVSTDLLPCNGEEDDAARQRLRVRIEDNGTGIAAEQLPMIFDPFYTTKEPGKGTGLGLSVSLSIIESMGGSMEMESEEGKGSVLSVFFPGTVAAATC